MDTSTHKRAFSVLRMILIYVLIDQEKVLYANGGHALLCSYCVLIVFKLCSDEIKEFVVEFVRFPNPLTCKIASHQRGGWGCCVVDIHRLLLLLWFPFFPF